MKIVDYSEDCLVNNGGLPVLVEKVLDGKFLNKYLIKAVDD